MKYLDDVRILTDKYEKDGVKKGAIGTIILSEIRAETFEVVFSDKDGWDHAETEIFVGDMEVVKSSHMTDEDIFGKNSDIMEYHCQNNPCLKETIFAYSEKMAEGFFGKYESPQD